ncbi:hypothetical protein [Cellulomonas sp. P24]|uniref:hypothetical protein n=1 Tax=Cellulomonas sp. P24 TaxID=2885206 RepID=UPI00216AEA34|nr:hypothetical protein [Cellulomonas sp. P24]MCR6493621.1 hypothetical protein [Cellulomonas sp. P24]
MTPSRHDHEPDEAGRRRGAERSFASTAGRAPQRPGAPARLTEELDAHAARRGLHRASVAVAAGAAAALVAAALSVQQTAGLRAWPSDSVFSLVMQLWVQVPVVCAAIASFLVVVAPRLRAEPLSGRPAELAGRNLALAGCLLLPVAVVAAGNLGTGMPVVERLLLATVAGLVPIAAVAGLRAPAHAARLTDRVDDDDVLDVIAAVAGSLAGRWASFGRAHDAVGRTWRAAHARAPRLTRWLDLRHHPWRAAASASVAAGLALKIPDLLIGDPDILASAIEAAAVYTSFAALGGWLGLRATHAYHAHTRVKLAATA